MSIKNCYSICKKWYKNKGENPLMLQSFRWVSGAHPAGGGVLNSWIPLLFPLPRSELIQAKWDQEEVFESTAVHHYHSAIALMWRWAWPEGFGCRIIVLIHSSAWSERIRQFLRNRPCSPVSSPWPGQQFPLGANSWHFIFSPTSHPWFHFWTSWHWQFWKNTGLVTQGCSWASLHSNCLIIRSTLLANFYVHI